MYRLCRGRKNTYRKGVNQTPLYEFFKVATIKRWGRKGRKKLYLTAEILPNSKKGEKGLLVTPFKLRELIKQNRKPKTLRTGQTRIEVNPQENIVNAAFKGYRVKGFDPKTLVLVASSKVQAMLPEPKTTIQRIRIRLGRQLAKPVKVARKVRFEGRPVYVVTRLGSPANLLAVKKGKKYFSIDGKAGAAIRSKLYIKRSNIKRRRL